MKVYIIKNEQNEDVKIFSLSNDNGFTLEVCEYGASLWRFLYPDGTDVIIGQKEKLDTKSWAHYGSICGRVAGRIRDAKFTLDGKEYTLSANQNNLHHRHGGTRGYSKLMWEGKIEDESNAIVMTYHSKDGEEGYPANVEVITRYTLTNDNELIMDTYATPDGSTMVNLTNHVYWNFHGFQENQSKVLDHELTLYASQYYDADGTETLPSGEILDVVQTALDFTKPKNIGADIEGKECAAYEGYDHIFKIDEGREAIHADFSDLQRAAFVEGNNKSMEIWTSCPAIVLYSANHLRPQHSAFCLETQFPADCPNIGHFPSIRISPEESWKQRTVWKFK